MYQNIYSIYARQLRQPPGGLESAFRGLDSDLGLDFRTAATSAAKQPSRSERAKHNALPFEGKRRKPYSTQLNTMSDKRGSLTFP